VKAAARRASSYQARNAVGWARLVEVWRTKALGPADLLNLVRKDVKLDEWLSRNVDEGEDSKAVDNLNEVVNFARNYETVDAMLDDLDAIDRHRAANARKRNAVTISTIHKSKGMEWQVVYLIHVAGGFFPGSRSDLNEERRLFYVACTRPKDELWVSRPHEIRGEEAHESRFTSVEGEFVEEKEYRVGIATPDTITVGTQMELS
jgi:DNA helicase-2/ATP-dependent DNA helicase PcrA